MGLGRKKPILPAIFLIFLFAFFGLSGPYHEADASIAPLFGSMKVQLSSGVYPVDSTELTAALHSGDTAMLGHFTSLRTADFSGSTCIDEIISWSAENPQVDLRYSVSLPDGRSVSNSETSLDLSGLSHADVQTAAEALTHLPKLQNVQLGQVGRSDSALNLSDLGLLRAALPEAELDFSLSLLGQEIFPGDEAVDLSSLTHEETDDAIAVLSCLGKLKSVTLGAESSTQGAPTWEDIALIAAACPDASIDYSFSIYGKEFNLKDTALDLRGIKVKDKGAAVRKVLPCMNLCTVLDMDSTGVSDKDMDELRKTFPDVTVIWRVWFGENYSVRTNAERILASKPTVGGMISDASVLKYCTEIKYLDLGHNDELFDLSFISSMPKLEVLIIAMTAITDISPLESCTELDYLELNSTKVSDISVLSKLPKLKHLNIGDCPKIKDISPLLSSTALERLWIGRNTPVPAAQVSTLKSKLPSCNINTTTNDPHGEAWRYTRYDPDEPKYYWVARYELIREQLGYNYQEYSFYWLDPLCELEAPAEFKGMFGKEVYG